MATLGSAFGRDALYLMRNVAGLKTQTQDGAKHHLVLSACFLSLSQKGSERFCEFLAFLEKSGSRGFATDFFSIKEVQEPGFLVLRGQH